MNGKISSPTATAADSAATETTVAIAEPPRLKPASVPAYLAGAGAGIVLLLALFEPATSNGLNLLGRLLFFALHIGPALALAWVLSGWLFGRRSLRNARPWLLLAVAGFVVGLVLAPWSVLLESIFGVVELDETPTLVSSSPILNELLDDLLGVPPKAAAIWLALNLAIAWRLHVNTGQPAYGGRTPPVPASEPAVDGSASPAERAAPTDPQAFAGDAVAPSLFARIPARYGRDVIYLEAQEHYLRVVLAGGEQLLLHGLANAMRELEAGGAAGMQVHRSYWVNWAHVRRVVANSGGGYCELASGVRIPISRRRAAAARAAHHAYPGQGGDSHQ